MMSGYTPVFTAFSGDIYSSDIVRSAIHAFATQVAKTQAKHIRRMGNTVENVNSKLEYLLTKRPNPHMNAFDFYYKIASQRDTHNNAYVLIQTEGFDIEGLYPIEYSNVETLEYNNETYVRFLFGSGKQLTVPYSQVIHLRKFFNKNEMYGESNYDSLYSTLELVNTTNQGIINAVKSSANIRGLLKFTTAMMSATDLKKQRDDFISDYMDINNNGGVVATDTKADYIPIENSPKIIDAEQMNIIQEKVWNYFNTNKAIITSKYTDEEWSAYYEAVLEPFFIQMGLEFTTKLFTKKELAHGNEIIFTTNRLQYATVDKKLAVITSLVDRGMMSQNQALEVFNLPPIEGGDKRIISLNFVDTSIANQYQLGKEVDATKTEVSDTENVDNKDNGQDGGGENG